MAMRPCATCGVPCDEGNCPTHPKARRWRNRPVRVTTEVYRSPEYRRARRVALISTRWCAYCKLVPPTTGDHIIPLARGGAWGWPNIVAACAPCNTSKGDRTVDEWIRSGLAPRYAHELLGRGGYAQ